MSITKDPSWPHSQFPQLLSLRSLWHICSNVSRTTSIMPSHARSADVLGVLAIQDPIH